MSAKNNIEKENEHLAKSVLTSTNSRRNQGTLKISGKELPYRVTQSAIYAIEAKYGNLVDITGTLLDMKFTLEMLTHITYQLIQGGMGPAEVPSEEELCDSLLEGGLLRYSIAYSQILLDVIQGGSAYSYGSPDKKKVRKTKATQ